MANVQSHFDGKIQKEILQKLNTAKYSIRLAMYTFNERELFEMLCQKAEEGVYIELLLDKNQSNNKWNKPILEEFAARLITANSSVLLFDNKKSEYANMHHKFCVIDERILITGSYNWTNNATNYSNENALIVEDDASTVQVYTTSFHHLKSNASVFSESTILPIHFTASKNVVYKGELVEFEWRVPDADRVTLNELELEKTLKTPIAVHQDRAFTLQVYKGEQVIAKTIKIVTIAKPKIKRFECSPNVIRTGQSTALFWEVTDAIKVRIEECERWSPSDVKHTTAKVQIEYFKELKSSKIVTPKSDTFYRIVAEDYFGKEYAENLLLRVASFPMPRLELIKVPVPQIRFHANIELQKSGATNKSILSLKSEVLERKPKSLQPNHQQFTHLNKERLRLNKQLEKNIQKRKISARFQRIRGSILRSAESNLNQLLTKLRNMD